MKLYFRASGSIVGIGAAQWAYFLHKQCTRWRQEKDENPSKLVCPPCSPISLGRPAGDGPSSRTSPPITANSPLSLEWGKESCRPIMVGHGVQQWNWYKAISALCPCYSTPGGLDLEPWYYYCHGCQMALLHYIHFWILVFFLNKICLHSMK